MFSAFFTQALELLGKSFLISAFFPTLVVTVGVALSVDPQASIDLLKAWAADPSLSNQATSALLVLASVYLLAYVIYGLREALTWLFHTGWLWLAPLISRRRDRFIEKRRNFDEAKRMSLTVPHATVWAESGFGLTEHDDNPFKGRHLGPKVLIRTRRQIRKLLKQLEANRNRIAAIDRLPIRWERRVERLLVGLHLLTFYSEEPEQRRELDGLIERTRQLPDSEERLAAWCRNIQHRTWGAIGEVHSADFHFPPEKYIRPTALGNVLGWIMTYPTERYGIGLDVVLPRLQKCIDADVSKLMEDRKTFLDFSVVFAALCYAAAAGFLLFGLVSVGLLIGTQPADEFAKVFEVDVRLLLIGLGWALACTIFYMIAVAAAKAYGLMLHSAVDLYRLKLLQSLHVKPPATLVEERQIWQELTTSFIQNTVPDLSFLPLASPQDQRESAPNPSTWFQRLKAVIRQIYRG